MTTKINPQAWVALRAQEEEFRAFLGVTTPVEAFAEGIARCRADNCDFSNSAFEKLRTEYLAMLRVKWGLPSNTRVG